MSEAVGGEDEIVGVRGGDIRATVSIIGRARLAESGVFS